jgi:hypothetical protein
MRSVCEFVLGALVGVVAALFSHLVLAPSVAAAIVKYDVQMPVFIGGSLLLAVFGKWATDPVRAKVCGRRRAARPASRVLEEGQSRRSHRRRNRVRGRMR